MDFNQRLQLANEFRSRVTMGPDRVMALSDRIQEMGQGRRELVARCKFGRSLQVRRLRMLASKHWNPSDWTAAQAILDEINSLQRDSRQLENVLGLTVLGVECEGIDALVEGLERGETPTFPVTEPAEVVPVINAESERAGPPVPPGGGFGRPHKRSK